MYNNDTELLFPPRVIESLKDLRGSEWDDLLEEVQGLPEDHPDHLAFVLMMTKLNGCMTCNSDSFRAMRGCTQCSILNVRRYRGSEKQLLLQIEKARKEITKKLEAKQKSKK